MPRLNIIAHTTPSHEHTVLWLTRQPTSVERWTKGVRRKERIWKKSPSKDRHDQPFNDMHLHDPLQLAMGASLNEHATPGLLLFMTSCFLHEKESPCFVSALCRSRAVDKQRWVRFAGGFLIRVGMPFSVVFSEWQIAALCFFFQAPSKWCSLDYSRKERHGFCEIHVRVFLLCDSS